MHYRFSASRPLEPVRPFRFVRCRFWGTGDPSIFRCSEIAPSRENCTYSLYVKHVNHMNHTCTWEITVFFLSFVGVVLNAKHCLPLLYNTCWQAHRSKTLAGLISCRRRLGSSRPGRINCASIKYLCLEKVENNRRVVKIETSYPVGSSFFLCSVRDWQLEK